MKKTFLLLLLFVFGLHTLFAQAPEMIKYQTVVRNSSGEVIKNQNVGFRISILQSGSTGTAVYSETHSKITNDFGLVNVEIGDGTVVSGLFSGIDWGIDNYFIKIEFDASNNGSFVEMGTSQLLSVPYALHAKTAESISGSSSKRYIGELFGGGIVYWVSPDGQHGLIVSLEDLGGGNRVTWSNITNIEIGASSQSMTDGASNTAAIVAQMGHIQSAAKLCLDYRGGGFKDWYLPSIMEMGPLNAHILSINYILNNDGDETTTALIIDRNDWPNYWSSTEDYSYAWHMTAGLIRLEGGYKDQLGNVRAIRAF